MKILSCPNCKKTSDIEFNDCGYSSFNCGGGKCKCGFESICCCLSWNVKKEGLISVWNEGVKKFNKYKKLKLGKDELKKLGVEGLVVKI